MSVPTVTHLRQGEVIVQPVTGTSVNINAQNILNGVIVKSYNNMMKFNLGDTVSFLSTNARPFKESEIPYLIINQQEIYFKVNPV